jgi:hypothetical protein
MSKGTVEQTSWNFHCGDIKWTDIDLFFGPLVEGEVTLPLQPGQDMLDILVLTGVFPSKTIARKNGWAEDREPTFRWKDRGGFPVVDTPGRSVPKGFTLFRIGKGKATEIAILNQDSAVQPIP